MRSPHPDAAALGVRLPEPLSLDASSGIWRAWTGRLAKGARLQLIATLIAVGTFALAIWIVVSDHAETRARAEASLSNLALALERDIERNIDLYALAMQDTADALALPGLAEISPELRRAALFSRTASSDYMNSILVIDPTGAVTYDSATLFPRAKNLTDQPFFKVPQQQDGTDLFISHPGQQNLILGETDDDRDILVLSRRLTTESGAAGGVVAGAVQIDFLRKLFSQLQLGAGGGVTLFHTDGTLIVRFPATPGDVGRNASRLEPFRSMQKAASGVMDGISALDGVKRIYAYRHIGRFPLMITTSAAVDTVFAAWRGKSFFILTTLLILEGIMALLLVAFGRQLARAADAERCALASAEQAARSERAVGVALSRLDTVFQHSADVQYGVSRRSDGLFAFDLLNRRGEELTGLRAADVLNKTVFECLPPAAAAIVAPNWNRCIELGEPVSYEQTLDLPIGRRDWETLLVPVRDASGNVYRLVGTARDVTDRKIAELALLRLNSTLERRTADAVAAQDDALLRASTSERLQVLGQLASGVAHDFNNVLQVVTSGVAIIERRSNDPDSMRKAARLIDSAASRGASITERLLAFSRNDPALSGAIMVGPMLAEVAEILRHTLRGAAPIEIVIDIGDPALTVEAEFNQLQTLLLNLATNARDAMPAGGTITFGARAEGPAVRSTAGTPSAPMFTYGCETTVSAWTPPLSLASPSRSSRPNPSAREPASACRWPRPMPRKPAGA